MDGRAKKRCFSSQSQTKMYHNHQLKQGQVFGNITVNFKNSFFLVGSSQKVTVTADILDFDSTRIARLENETATEGITSLHGFNLGEEVLIKLGKNWEKVFIIKLGMKKIVIQGTDNENKLFQKELPPFKIFRHLDAYENKERNFKLGEVVQTKYAFPNDGEKTSVKGTIIAYNEKFTLLNINNKRVKVKNNELYR